MRPKRVRIGLLHFGVRILTVRKSRTNITHRQRIFKSRNNRPEDHFDDVEGPKLEVVAVCQGKEEVTMFASVLLVHSRLCRRCAWFFPIRTELTGETMWSRTLQRLAVPTTSQTSLYFMNIEGHLVRLSASRAYLYPLSSHRPDAMIVSLSTRTYSLFHAP